jgi:predicted nucleotidyltransferase component of viral defense system
MKIPLALKLKRKLHRDIALAQDLLVEQLYKIFEKAVLHDGTAIWRCYGSNRFSEDVDVYVKPDGASKARMEKFFESLKRIGFEIAEKRIKTNSVFSRLKLGQAEIRFEAIFKPVKAALGNYEKIDGSSIVVFTLTPEQLIEEKVSAYTKRLKIRDLYDIAFLLEKVKDRERVRKAIKALLSKYRPPKDEKELRVLLLTGAVPNKEQILAYIKRWQE